jgi:hypothetical protein
MEGGRFLHKQARACTTSEHCQRIPLTFRGIAESKESTGVCRSVASLDGEHTKVKEDERQLCQQHQYPIVGPASRGENMKVENWQDVNVMCTRHHQFLDAHRRGGFTKTRSVRNAMVISRAATTRARSASPSMSSNQPCQHQRCPIRCGPDQSPASATGRCLSPSGGTVNASLRHISSGSHQNAA